MTENKSVNLAMRADLSDHQIRELPIGSLRHLTAAQLPPDGGESVGRRLRVARALAKARRSRGCGTVENRSATRQGGRFSKRLWETGRDPPKAGGFPRWLWEDGGKGIATGRKAGALSAGLPQSPAGAAVPQPILDHRIPDPRNIVGRRPSV